MTLGSIGIDCSRCDGPLKLEERRCFIGLARRLPPGFSGDVVLSGPVDRRYSGPPVSCLISFSEVIELLEGIPGSGARRGFPFIGKKDVSKVVKRAVATLQEDPQRLIADREELLKDMSKAAKGGKGNAVRELEAGLERTSLMVRRLQKDLSSGRQA